MIKKGLHSLPREAAHGSWPLLQPTEEDKAYRPRAESPLQRKLRLLCANLDLLYQDLRAALFKGAILGVIAFGMVSSIGLNLPFWLQEWHWVFGLAGIILLSVLIGVELALVVLALCLIVLGALNPSLGLLVFPTLFLCIAGGMFIRGLIELWPVRT